MKSFRRTTILLRKPCMRKSALPLALLLGAFIASPATAQMDMKQSGQQMPMKEGMQMEMAKEGVFQGQGKVIAIVSEKNQIVLQHGEVKGLMGPMTMGYAVQSPALMNGLKPGDSVKFKIDAAKKEIVAVERLPN